MHASVHYRGWKRTWDEWDPACRPTSSKWTNNNLAYPKARPNQHSNVGVTGGSGSHHKAGGSGAHKSTGGSGGEGGVAGAAWTSPQAAAARREDAMGSKSGRDEDDPARKTEMKPVVAEVLKQIWRKLGACDQGERNATTYSLREPERLIVTIALSLQTTGKEMGSTYGAEHLSTMSVTVPAMVTQSSLDKGPLDPIRGYANELIECVSSSERK
ncbi:hypothetical protein BKA70DRAFT_1227257 [Coprinopsis sp. MPI-PUGE-AT-0042]|nr:hypothetical protein BKA70DRAFT_1227257 [Coprinopsis sp. MPI-PUGE-AT-0042]